MIAIERHIISLLLSNDCVIVPGLGGFMSHHVPARFDDEDNTFLPPIRTLGFNQQLTINDSLLAQSYIETYDLSYPEAIRKIESDVNEIRQRLDDKGVFEMHGIGTLSVNDEGKLEFTPCLAGILSPSLYALSSFEISPLTASVKHSTARVKPALPAAEPAISAGMPIASEASAASEQEEPAIIVSITDNEETPEEHKAVCIPLSAVRYAIAAAMLVFAFFLMPSQPGSDMTQESSMCGSAAMEIKTLPKAEPVAKEKAKPAPAKEKAKPAPAKEQDIEKPATAEPVAPKVQSFHTIVLASKVSIKNAEAFVDRLHKAGCADAEVYTRGTITRVISGRYTSEQEAINALHTLRGLTNEAADAWTLKIEN